MTHSSALEDFRLYTTKSRLYLVASNGSRSGWRFLKFSRGSDLEVTEDPVTYSVTECNTLLQEIHDGNRNVGGLKLVCTAQGIAGCVRFLEGYYLLLITKRRFVGQICNNNIYGMEEVRLQPIMHPDLPSSLSRLEKTHEQRYVKLLMQVLENKEFFFSYSYRLHQTLQVNLMGPRFDSEADQADPFSSMFVWNTHLTKDLQRTIGHERWLLPLVHGFFQQRTLSIFGRVVRVTLIARRSRHFAGTRYRKRGVNKQGKTANDVETEQMVDATGEWTGAPWKLASVVQVRGSIPLFWSQEEATLTAPKPDITLQHFDPLFNATRLHFKDLAVRYGYPTHVLNLVKRLEKAPRESVLGDEFSDAVRYLNKHLPKEEQIVYMPLDLRQVGRMWGRASHLQLIRGMLSVVKHTLDSTGIFSYVAHGKPLDQRSYAEDGAEQHGMHLGPLDLSSDRDVDAMEASMISAHNQLDASVLEHDLGVSEQMGVLRTNCIDCLDRTNVAQFAFGLVALSRQFAALAVTTHTVDIHTESSMSVELGLMYEAMGNCLAQQYGGSDAHTKFFKDQRGEWGARTQSEDVMTSIRRIYSNINTDPEKQDAMNLFLGRFTPQLGKPPVWELGNDAHLHASRGLLLDEDNFDIFWGETLGQSGQGDEREQPQGSTGYLPRPKGWTTPDTSSEIANQEGGTACQMQRGVLEA